MTFKFISKIALFALLGLVVFSSCSKEDSVTLVETEEELPLQFQMTINGTTVQTDAVAGYCQNDSVEFIIIANKEANLSFPLETQNFEPDDFTYFTSISDESTWSYGGQAFGEDVTGNPGLLISFSNAIITIEANDGQTVVGSSEGTLYGLDDQGLPTIEYPYSMEFTAEIIQESTFCE